MENEPKITFSKKALLFYKKKIAYNKTALRIVRVIVLLSILLILIQIVTERSVSSISAYFFVFAFYLWLLVHPYQS